MKPNCKFVKTFLMAFVTASSIFVASGCSNNSGAEYIENTYIPLEFQVNKSIKVIFDSQLLVKSVGLASSKITTGNGAIKSIVEIKNIAGVPYTVEYQTIWYDADGVPQQSSPSWKRKSLPANGEFTIVDVAKQPNLNNIKLYFRLPSDVELWVPVPNPIEEYHNQNNNQL